MNKVTNFIERIAKEYGYKPLPADKSKLARDWYVANLPTWLNLEGGEIELDTECGTQICNGYTRIVVGDYGAYIEFSKEQACTHNFVMPDNQKYRTTAQYKDRVKYYWYTAKDDSNCKIYWQRRPVSYADYKPNMCYISVYEVIVRH